MEVRVALARAIQSDDYREQMAAIRDDLAQRADDTDSMRDYAATVKSLITVVKDIYEYDCEHGRFAPKAEESPLAKAQARRAVRGA